jgi:hypothetical protein
MEAEDCAPLAVFMEPSSNTATALAALQASSPSWVKETCGQCSLPACLDMPAATAVGDGPPAAIMSSSEAAAQAADLERQLAGVQQQMAQMQNMLMLLKARQVAHGPALAPAVP